MKVKSKRNDDYELMVVTYKSNNLICLSLVDDEGNPKSGLDSRLNLKSKDWGRIVQLN